MESQPTQQGMMQLFMSLGLSQNKAFTALELDAGTGQGIDSNGFASLLQQYQEGGENNLLASGSANSLTGLETDGGNLPLTQGLAQNSINEETLPPIGQGLPLKEASLPSFREAAQLQSLESRGAGIKSIPADENQEDEAQVNAEFEGQNYQAQSLVASVLTNPETQLSQSMVVSQGAYLGANSPTSVATNAGPTNRLINTQASNPSNALTTASLVSSDKLNTQGATNLSLMPDSSSIDASSAELNGEQESALEGQVDKFLGADGRHSSANHKTSELNVGISQQGDTAKSSNPAGVSQELNVALAQAEDPSLESLQDLEAIEELEQAEIESRLATTERKQDEQTLKLSKGQQAWGEALTERITMNAAKEVKQVTIHLDPPELGSLELKLQVKEDQQTQVQVQVQNPQVKEALESSAQRLRDMLANQGLELSEFDVQTGAQQGGAQGEQQVQAEELGGQQDSDALTSSEEEISLDISRPKNNNLLDTFV
jgi:flagellar hook-length control protein FliK